MSDGNARHTSDHNARKAGALTKRRNYRLLDLLTLCLRVAPVEVVCLFTLAVATGILPALTALASTAFVDTALALRSGAVARDAITMPILYVVLSVAASWLMAQVGEYCGRILTLKTRATVRPDMVEKCAKLEYRHIEDPKTWDIISRVTKQPETELSTFASNAASALTLALNVLSVIGLLFDRVWWAALVTLMFSVPLMMLALKGGKESYQANRDTEREERLQEYLYGTLISREAAEERAMFRYTAAMIKKYAEAFARAYKLRFKVMARWFIRTKLSSVLFSLISILVALTLLFPTINGDITIGMFMSLVAVTFSLVQSMSWQLSNCTESFAKSGEYAKDLTRFLKLSEQPDALCAPKEQPMAFESLELRDVTFRYPGVDKPVLKHMNFSLRAGQHVAIVGVNGAGKTTLTKLITAMYDGYEGDILLNGRELRTLPQDAVKSLYAIVFQDFARYQVPLRDNIALEHKDREERIPAIADALEMKEIIADLKKGLDTPLGKLYPDGQELSGGQWQRVAIARALVNPAPIRILDEPTAALDPISEANLYGGFRSMSRGTATLFISHRLGSTKLADRIDVIGDRRVIESGTHDELMAVGGVYADMFEAQRSWYQ